MFLGRCRSDAAFRKTYHLLTHLAEKVAKKDYYIKNIRWLRELFDREHPVATLIRDLLRNRDPHHRNTIVQTLVINQMLEGTNKRRAFHENGGGFYPPGCMVVSPTTKCNLSCYGCYAGSPARQSELGYPVVNRILNEAKAMGIHFVAVTGGEPLCWDHTFRMFEEHNDVFFLMYTHGGLLDEKAVQRLVSAGNVLPLLSLEGFEEETDARRGRGHYARVMHAMDLLREAGVMFGFSSTQTRRNIDVISSDEFLDLMTRKGCMIGFYFLYVPVGRNPDLSLVPTPEQRNRVQQAIMDWRSKRPMLFIDFWGDSPLVGGCIAGGRKYFHVNSSGDVEPCVFCHFASHNVHTSSLREALNSELFRNIRSLQPYSENLLRPCMVLDHPAVGREIVESNRCRFTHRKAERFYNELADWMDEWSRSFAPYAEEAWQRHPFNRKRA
jgi:MoaA/NifB/PqqE/SkfB family radical SAM enzyme